jgi:hypothetical protein
MKKQTAMETGLGLDSLTEDGMSKIIDRMTDEEREHFKTIVSVLVRCYGDEPVLQGVLILGAMDADGCSVSSMNCDEMEALKLLQAANEFLLLVNTHDAPPKEMLN